MGQSPHLPIMCLSSMTTRALIIFSQAHIGQSARQQMNRVLDHYKKTSQNAWQRGLAQHELARLSGKNQIAEQAAKLQDKVTQTGVNR